MTPLTHTPTGDGAPFWQGWANVVLPNPDALCTPMLWGPTRLSQLQHESIAQGASAQRVRECACMFMCGWARALA